MKRYVVTIAMLSLLAACGGSSTEANKDSAANTAAGSSSGSTDISQNPDYEKGLALIGSSDCLTCHKVNEKLIGPAYSDVADKYAGSDTAVAYLSHKVITGGAGVWGSVPMTAHPQLSQADAEQMVKYVLLLKTK